VRTGRNLLVTGTKTDRLLVVIVGDGPQLSDSLQQLLRPHVVLQTTERDVFRLLNGIVVDVVICAAGAEVLEQIAASFPDVRLVVFGGWRHQAHALLDRMCSIEELRQAVGIE
jgi:hypothetical protein